MPARRSAALTLAGALSAAAATGPSPVTFNRDVLPVLQRHCQECHRPGEAAPMSFLDYRTTRPWAKAIQSAVLSGKMPPWFADPAHGSFANERRLTPAEIRTLSEWAGSGAPEGDTNAPAPVRFAAGWTMGQPDKIFEMPQPISVPARGVIEYTYVVIPTGFDHDMWVQAAEARPGARSAMHHVIAYIRGPGSQWLKVARPGIPYIPNKKNSGDEGPSELLVGYAPGLQATVLRPGQAKLIPAGSDLVLQLHYTPNGKPAEDVTRIGLIFAKEPPAERVMTFSAANNKLKIPPGDANYEIRSQATLDADAKLVSLMPHMHLRGRDFEYRAVYPGGETKTLLRVPRYDFNWQLGYELKEQLPLPKGSRIECTAHYDNSPNNPYNPDPAAEVHWGDQTFEEMMIGFFDLAFDPHLEPRRVLRANRPAEQNSPAQAN